MKGWLTVYTINNAIKVTVNRLLSQKRWSIIPTTALRSDVIVALIGIY